MITSLPQIGPSVAVVPAVIVLVFSVVITPAPETRSIPVELGSIKVAVREMVSFVPSKVCEVAETVTWGVVAKQEMQVISARMPQDRHERRAKAASTQNCLNMVDLAFRFSFRLDRIYRETRVLALYERVRPHSPYNRDFRLGLGADLLAYDGSFGPSILSFEVWRRRP